MCDFREFCNKWLANGNYVEDGCKIVSYCTIRGTVICDFIALLLDPTRSTTHRYIHKRARTRLATQSKFTMNCWQFVLIYLHECHGLTFDDIHAIYARIQTGMRVPDFFHGAEHTTRLPGCVVCYIKDSVVWHTEIVADVSSGIGICCDVVSNEIFDDSVDDKFYLDPVAVVVAIRQNIRNFAKNPLADIDNISATDNIDIAIAYCDDTIKALIDTEVGRYAADIPADVIALADIYTPPWYTAEQIDTRTRQTIAHKRIPTIRKVIVDKLIANCI